MNEDELAKKIKQLVIKTLEESTVTLDISSNFRPKLKELLKKYEESNKPKSEQVKEYDADELVKSIGNNKDNKKRSFGGKTKRKYRRKKRTLRH